MGAPVYLDVDVRTLDAGDGEPRRALLMIRDVTDRVAEHERAALFYESFRSSTNVMQLTDANGIMVDVNPAYEKVYGYSREECIGPEAEPGAQPAHRPRGVRGDVARPRRPERGATGPARF